MFTKIAAAQPTRGGVRVYTAGLLLLGAAAIHFAVTREHLEEFVPFGVFFLAVGSLQALIGVDLLVRPSRRLAFSGAATNVVVIAIWLVSRTYGVPVGPAPGTPEEVGFADVVCSVMEAVSALLLILVAQRALQPQVRARWKVALGTLSLALVAVALGAAGVAAAANDMPVAVNVAPAVPGQPSRSVTSLNEPAGGQPVDTFTLTAEPAEIDGHTVWAFNGSVPGPELRVTQGDRVRVTLINHLPDATTVHWHGIRLPDAEDGVAGITRTRCRPDRATHMSSSPEMQARTGTTRTRTPNSRLCAACSAHSLWSRQPDAAARIATTRSCCTTRAMGMALLSTVYAVRCT